MSIAAASSASLPPDAAEFIRTVETSPEAAAIFERTVPISIGRAPGRLDVMGGIADYSGSLVLQMPIGEAALVALQLLPPAAMGAPPPRVRCVSLGASSKPKYPPFEMPLSGLFAGDGGAPTPLAALRERFDASADGEKWAAYVVGVLAVLSHEAGASAKLAGCGGVSVLVASDVPDGKGVSSSAAVEVGTMAAALGALGLELAPRERVALLCQRAENFVVGAPCGVMDQMASALGEADGLMQLLCQPADVREPVPIPPHARFWGIDSGVRHSVGGSDYGTVRVAAFIGRALLREATGLQIAHLAHLAPSHLARHARALPSALRGADFLATHPAGHGDDATAVDPDGVYDARACASHPVHEHFRVTAFRELLRADAPTDERRAQQLELLGECMYQSHESYSSVGLGSEATDEIVDLVRDRGARSGLYGAKITGGGSGGTVCVLSDASPAAEASLREVVLEYARRSAERAGMGSVSELPAELRPYVVEGSSMGALAFGHVRLVLENEGRKGGERWGWARSFG